MRGLTDKERDFLEECIGPCEHGTLPITEREWIVFFRLKTRGCVEHYYCVGCGEDIIVTTTQGKEALRLDAIAKMGVTDVSG